MAEIRLSDGKYSISISEREGKKLKLNPKMNYKITAVKGGVYLLVETTPKEDFEKKLFELLEKKGLSERVVGRFERFLNQKELAALSEMLKAGKIEKFKLSDKYKKPVYRIVSRKFAGKDAYKQVPKMDERKPDSYGLRKNGFLILRNEMLAKKISEEYADEIKKGKIKGLKGFDGAFYIIRTDKYCELEQKLLSFFKSSNSASLGELMKSTGLQKEVIKLVCEFMKESGDLIEKKPERYEYIE